MAIRRFPQLVLLAAAAAVFLGCSESERASSQSARLEEMEGVVRVVRDGEIVEAEVDMEIFSGDEVVTLLGGQVTISLLDDHLVRLSEGSRFVLEEMRPRSVSGALWARVRLLAGQVYASLGELTGGDADFTIATSSAVCAVKGTTFGVEVADGETTVSVEEGEVDMAAVDEAGRAGERIRIKPGYESTCRAGMRERIRARRMPPERRKRVRKRLKAAREHARRFRKMRRSGELHDLRRLRAMARAGKIDEAGGKLKKRLRRNPGLREQIIKHGERHRRIQQDRRQRRQHLDRAPGKNQGKRGQSVNRSVNPAGKKRAIRRAAPARKKEAVRRAAPSRKKEAVRRAARKDKAVKRAAPAQKKTPASPRRRKQ